MNKPSEASALPEGLRVAASFNQGAASGGRSWEAKAPANGLSVHLRSEAATAGQAVRSSVAGVRERTARPPKSAYHEGWIRLRSEAATAGQVRSTAAAEAVAELGRSPKV
ncbi:MAG: hypothetical protein FJ405_06265 [Verrucomicrobia bacterium]|nr:hypothetical protein [Verrucomicrobiota bacterium]